MKKRLFGVILAAALMVTQAVAVFAAPSGTTTPTTVTNGTVSAPADFAAVGVPVETAQILNSVNASTGSAALSTLAAAVPSLAGELSGKVMATPFVEISGAQPNAAGKFEVGIPAPSLPANATVNNTRAIHYSTARGVWESKKPDSIVNGVVNVTFDDLSPVAIVTVGSATSPRTGVASDWMIWMSTAAVLFAAAGLTLRKRA